MRARQPDETGVVVDGGVEIGYEVFGSGPGTILLLPTWTIINSRFWKMQVPYLARQHRVITYDGPGNGRSGRPLEQEPYDQRAQVAHALAVLDATGTEQALVVGLSKGAEWALGLAAEHPDRVAGLVVIAPAVALAREAWAAVRGAREEAAPLELPPSLVPLVQTDPPTHWAKYDRGDYWHERYDDFLWFFFGQCFSERFSTKPIEDCVGWGRETSGDLLVIETRASRPDPATVEALCARISCPVLVLHGDDDHVVPLAVGEALAELVGGELVVLEGCGHLPLARDPVRVNLLVHGFAERCLPRPAVRRTWQRWTARRPRVLYLSSPIGLGHARRDIAIAQQLRERRPDVEIAWLAQHPVTDALARAGERVHPASRELVNESAHIEDESGEHDLHCFEALRRMDEILMVNFMVFHDLVEEERFDLVVGDESWDVDHFLHENPELKRSAYAWMTDFVGMLPMPDGGEREALVAADTNAEMIGHVERFPQLRDRAIFVGDPEDVVDGRFGADLPVIRDWTERHYDFAGYVTGFDPATLTDREELRAELGYAEDERVCVVTVGGSGVGGDLLRRVVDAVPEAARKVDGLRMVVVTGPRIDPASVPARDGLEVRAYVPDLQRHLAACDLAVVQGGLSTCMELTALGRPFVFVPLRHHFEQQFHVAHRLRRYGAGRRLDYDDLTPETLAATIAEEVGRETTYRPVAGHGAARAAALLADLL